MQEIPAFGGGATGTILDPVVLVVMLITIGLMFLLPRKYVIVPFLFSCFLIPLSQQVYFGGSHWFVYRIIVMFGLLRLLIGIFSSQESTFAGGINIIDKTFAGCILAEAICTTLQWGLVSLANQVGFLIDFMGAYILLRWLIRDKDDIYRALKCFAALAAILGFAMLFEQVTMRNAFGFLRGVRAVPEVRDGRIRSQAAFGHPLTAGTFGGTLVPLFLILWKGGKSKFMAALGIVGCTLMMLTANSSTPPLAYVGGIFAICLWPIRKSMRAVRWVIVIGLLVVNAIMKAPIWFIIAHIDLTGSSGGYHRAELIDQFFHHFWDWWLIGSHDMVNWGIDIWDIQNQFVQIGETGGLVAFVLFIAVVTLCFKRIGYARKFAENSSDEWVLWFFCAAIFANCVGFFGVNYFDQTKVGWFTLLAMVSTVTFPYLEAHPLGEKVAEVQVPRPRLAAQAPAHSVLAMKNTSYSRETPRAYRNQK